MIKRALVAIFLAVVAVPVFAAPCWACTCGSSGTPEDQRHSQAENADLVFTGIAKARRIKDPSPGDRISGDERIFVKFRVGKIYKGHPGRWETIFTGTAGDSCRYGFKLGRRYTVFAYEHNDRYVTSSCSGTKRGRIDPENYGLPRGHRPN